MGDFSNRRSLKSCKKTSFEAVSILWSHLTNFFGQKCWVKFFFWLRQVLKVPGKSREGTSSFHKMCIKLRPASWQSLLIPSIPASNVDHKNSYYNAIFAHPKFSDENLVLFLCTQKMASRNIHPIMSNKCSKTKYKWRYLTPETAQNTPNFQ